MFDPLRDYRRLFRAAAWYGVLTILPHFFVEEMLSRHFPPAIMRPQYYYGFLVGALTWQFALFLIAKNPLVFRPFLVPLILQKIGYAVCCVSLVMQDLNHPIVGVAGSMEILLGAFLFRSYIKLGAWTM